MPLLTRWDSAGVGGSQEPLTGGTALPRAPSTAPGPHNCAWSQDAATPSKKAATLLPPALPWPGAMWAQPCISAYGKHHFGHVAALVSKHELWRAGWRETHLLVSVSSHCFS